MPLKKAGKKVLEKMEKQYGEKKGEKVFYASMNMHKPGTEMWHEPKEHDDMPHNSPLMRYSKKRKK